MALLIFVLSAMAVLGTGALIAIYVFNIRPNRHVEHQSRRRLPTYRSQLGTDPNQPPSGQPAPLPDDPDPKEALRTEVLFRQQILLDRAQRASKATWAEPMIDHLRKLEQALMDARSEGRLRQLNGLLDHPQTFLDAHAPVNAAPVRVPAPRRPGATRTTRGDS